MAPPTSDSAEVSFSCPGKHGAALSLPVVARREDTLSQAHFGKWMTRNIDSLFAFSQRHGLGVEMEDIILVTGCHRTRSWSNVSFYESQADSRVSLSVQTPSTHGTTVRWRVLSQGMQGAVLNRGPSGENLPDSQCLFIRGFRVKRILWIIPRLKGAAEPQPDPGENDYEPELELVPIPSVTECQDPLRVLLDHIATRAPDCDMALVHDDDLVRILEVGDGTSLEDFRPDVVMDYLQRSKLEIGIMFDLWATNNESSRTDTEGMTVAMLSERLRSLCPPAPVPLHSGNTADTMEMTDDNASSIQSRNPSDSGPVITEPKISVDDVANLAERFLSVGQSGDSRPSLISGVSQGVSGLSNTDVSQYKPGEPDVQQECSRTGDSGGEDETSRIRAKMRATDVSERQASLPTNRITVGLPGSEAFAGPSFHSDPETSGSDAELLTSGTSSDTAFYHGNESCVIDTDVELECSSRYTFTRKEQGVDWYVGDPDERRKEAGSPIKFASVGSDNADDSDVSETGTRALASIQRSSIAIHKASVHERSFREREPDLLHTQPNVRPREENTTVAPRPSYIDAEGDVSATVTSPNRDQDPPSAPRNWANIIPHTDGSGLEMYQGMNLDYIMNIGGSHGLGTRRSSRSSLSFVAPDSLPLPSSKNKRKAKDKKRRNKGKEKRKIGEYGSPSDSQSLPDVAPWTDIMAPRHPSTITVDESFGRAPRPVHPVILRRNEWSFICNRMAVSFPPSEPNNNQRYWDVWRCSQIGQIRVQRVVFLSSDPNKPNHQRLNAEHDIDPDSANTLGGPTTMVHRHSRAFAFSIYRNYRNYSSRGSRESAGTSSTNSPSSSETRTRIVSTHDRILLATRLVQEQFTSTKSTQKIGNLGLVPEEGDNHCDSRREPLSNDTPGLRTLSPSVTSIIPPWMTLAPHSIQKEGRRVVQAIKSSFKDVGFVPSTRSTGDVGIGRGSKGKEKDMLNQVPHDSLYMLLPLWPHETDPASAARGVGQRKVEVADRGQKLYLLVYYAPFGNRGEGNLTKERSRFRPRKGERDRRYPTPPFDIHRGIKVIGRLIAHSDLNGAEIRLPTCGLSVTGSLAEAELGIPPASLRDAHPDDFVIGACLDRDGTSIIEFFPEGLERLGLCVPRTEPPVQDHSLPGMQIAEPENEDLALQPLTAIGRAAVEVTWLGCMAIMTLWSAV